MRKTEYCDKVVKETFDKVLAKIYLLLNIKHIVFSRIIYDKQS